jgi:16S rRNA (adenine1518-N6/adenine1519-N6)-dimethyltransferase
MLRNALTRAGWPTQTVEAALQTAGVEGRRRGETLTLEEFARVSEALPVREGTAAGDTESGSDKD